MGKRRHTYLYMLGHTLWLYMFSEVCKKERIVEIWAFSGEMGLELDFKGIEQIIIWTGIMYYRMNLEAAIHWLELGDFIY